MKETVGIVLVMASGIMLGMLYGEQIGKAEAFDNERKHIYGLSKLYTENKFLKTKLVKMQNNNN